MGCSTSEDHALITTIIHVGPDKVREFKFRVLTALGSGEMEMEVSRHRLSEEPRITRKAGFL